MFYARVENPYEAETPDEYSPEVEAAAGVASFKIGKTWYFRDVETGMFISNSEWESRCFDAWEAR